MQKDDQKDNFQQRLFNAVRNERWYQICKGLKATYFHQRFIICDQTQANLDIARKLFIEKKHCLAIYTTKEPGKLVTLIQPFWYKFNYSDPYEFQNISATFDERKIFVKSQRYYFCIYRYASDFVYKAALSNDQNYFSPVKKQGSSNILRYLKKEASYPKVDQKFLFYSLFQFTDQDQAQAIIASGVSSLMILRGGAGTGKTLTSCKIGLSFCLEKKKVLIATVTNAAAKAIASHLVKELSIFPEHEKLLELMAFLKEIKTLMTVYPPNTERINLLDRQIKWKIDQISKINIKIQFLYFNTLVTFQEYFCLHPLLRMYSFNTHILINFIKLTNYQTPIVDVLMNLNKIAHKIMVTPEIKALYIASVQMTVSNINCLVSTGSRAAIINNFQPEGYHFQPYLAIIDEAAQATLPDLYAVLSMNIQRLFFVGDEKQLSPSTVGPNRQLRYSIMSFLQDIKIPQLLLKNQHRMNHQIAHLVSHLRYEGTLGNGSKKNIKISELQGFQDNPILMMTHNQPESKPPAGVHEFGYCNLHEIMMIKLFIDQYPDEKLQHVGIITIYRAQVQLMKKVFVNQIKLGLVISTVDGYQGGEKDHFIASIVRSNQFGTLDSAEDKNRITVLLSRARKGLMLIGNADTLNRGWYDNPWRSVIAYLQSRDAIFHFDDSLNQRAIDNFATRRPRNIMQERDIELLFDPQDQEYNHQVMEFHFETDMLPLLKSDYN